MIDQHNAATPLSASAIRRQALEDAAKAMCVWCNQANGKTVHKINDDYKHWHKCLSRNHPDGHSVECHAAPIHAMIQRERERDEQR